MKSSVRCAVLFVLFCVEWWGVEASRILVVVPTPTHSHQVVFRPLTQELVRRGHQVVVLTTDPAFPPGQTPQNLTEIPLYYLSQKLWTEGLQKVMTGKESDYNTQVQTAYEIMIDIFQKQMKTKEVRAILSDRSQKFDLVIMEAWVLQALALAHIYNSPAILLSTLGVSDETYEYLGAPTHPILYPDCAWPRRYILSLWEHAKMLYNRIEIHYMLKSLERRHDVVIKDIFGEDMPPLQELTKYVELEFVSMHPMWEGYRPMPLNVVHLGGMNYAPPKDLPEDLKLLMDSSTRGVIYMSFGSNANPSLLPPERLEVFARVFATLAYDVLWKWKEAPQNLSRNVHTFSWLPQPDLLRHEKLVLFITQGGLQSTDEALRAGVPLLGIPLLIDQWLNAENYERLGVGMQLNLFKLSETTLREAIETLINDNSYRERSVWVGRVMQDRAQSVLAHAVWWAERAMRLRGRCMTTPPPPPLTWDDLLQVLLLSTLIVPVSLIVLATFLYKILSNILLKVVTMCRCFWRAHMHFSKPDQVSSRTS